MSRNSKIIIKEANKTLEEVTVEEEQNKFLYILDYTFVKKYFTSSGIKKSIQYEYLPLINTTKLLLDQLVNSNFLIYLKNTKLPKSKITGYYGYFTGGEILINNTQSKNIKNKINFKIDENEYIKMVKNYGLSVMDNLVFVKYKSIIQFYSIVSGTKYKTICQENNIQYEKILGALNYLNIVQYKIDEPIEYIKLELEKEAENEAIDKDDDENETENEEENKKDVEDLEEIIHMNIPIVWNPCNIIINKMDEMKIKKIEIIEHYKNCALCDVTDNNRKKLDFTNDKINLQVKEGDPNKEKIDTIINFYQFDKNYIEKKSQFDDMFLFEDKINIIYYKCEDELYDKSIFLITK